MKRTLKPGERTQVIHFAEIYVETRAPMAFLKDLHRLLKKYEHGLYATELYWEMEDPSIL